MNDTAKKLRNVAAYIKDYGVASVLAIARVRDALGVGKTDTTARDLGAVLDTIADELDELQARAAGANNLRQQLESAEDKAERRKRHIGYLNTALHDKNGLLERRGGTIARLTAENAELRKQVPTEREREILDMWPRFEDGEYVMVGDGVELDPIFGDGSGVARAIEFMNFTYTVRNYIGKPIAHGCFEARVKRPAPKVLDADGVEIKVGDTVYEPNGQSGIVTAVHPSTRSVDLRQDGCDAYAMDTKRLTHTRPDSWERLEMDAGLNDETGVVGGNLDIVRRAKALAGVEVD